MNEPLDELALLDNLEPPEELDSLVVQRAHQLLDGHPTSSRRASLLDAVRPRGEGLLPFLRKALW